MNCPACARPLSAHQVGETTLDVCRDGCGGIWFDARELQQVDEPTEPVADDLLALAHDESVTVDRGARRPCPCCPETVMMRHWFTVEREIEVDECPRCGGYFLDRGELAAIRAQFPGEEARREAARAMFATLFDDQLDAEQQASSARAERARRFAHMLRFVLPSWWLPGKQPWGAY